MSETQWDQGGPIVLECRDFAATLRSDYCPPFPPFSDFARSAACCFSKPRVALSWNFNHEGRPVRDRKAALGNAAIGGMVRLGLILHDHVARRVCLNLMNPPRREAGGHCNPARDGTATPAARYRRPPPGADATTRSAAGIGARRFWSRSILPLTVQPVTVVGRKWLFTARRARSSSTGEASWRRRLCRRGPNASSSKGSPFRRTRSRR